MGVKEDADDLYDTGVTIGGWLGWMLGADLGFMADYLLSFLGSLIGVVAAWWINKNYL